jgi:hypothetical protein
MQNASPRDSLVVPNKAMGERGGIDAFNAAEANDLAKIELGKKWKDLSYATDFVKTDF